MSKRKLTRRQSWRIEKIQTERIARAKKRDQRAQELLGEGDLGAEQQGLVVAHYGTQVAVEDEGGVEWRCHLRANIADLVAGDRVIWCAGKTEGVVVARHERDTELLRPDPHGGMKAVAANIDQVLIVVAARPEPVATRIDRYLVAARAVGMDAIIVLNKADLLGDDNREAVAALLALYQSIGYQVLTLSAYDHHTLAPLEAALNGRTSIFSGPSGVGKSSLVNSLLPRAEQRVGEVSEANRSAGRHTTTTARLFHLTCGGTLIDSPGIREFGLWHMSREQIENGFIEFLPLLGHCQFRNCQHEREPGCALLEGLENGAIHPARFESYRLLVGEIDN